MSKVVVFMNLTLDGVMQAPGRPDEDRRGGFEHGGWAMPYADHEMGKVAAESMAATGALVFGRRTYEDFYSVWPNRTDDNPFTTVLNNTPKYVASTTLEEPLRWVNSTLLRGDGAKAVAKLKEQPGKDLVILGSGELVRSLMRRLTIVDGLDIDGYYLFHAIRAELLRRMGRGAEAALEYEAAIGLTENGPERALMERSRQSLST
jgi:dihydrofolate reductase